MRKLFYLLPLLLIMGCAAGESGDAEAVVPNDWHELDLSSFTIQVPGNWNFKEPSGQPDALSGKIVGPEVFMSFDYSVVGPVDSLVLTEKEYLQTEKWWQETFAFPVRAAERKIIKLTPEQSAKYLGADYVADLTYKGQKGRLPIHIPAEIKAQNFKVDSNGKYVFKTTWPKVTGKGVTGINIHARYSPLNFQLSGTGLSKADQDKALLVFKTVKFKHDQE